jgi:hypothetical protein
MSPGAISAGLGIMHFGQVLLGARETRRELLSTEVKRIEKERQKADGSWTFR